MPPTIAKLLAQFDFAASGAEMYRFAEQAYPICRSVTGDGVRETLRILGEAIPLEVREVASGTKVLDWTVPKEWNLRRAWIKGPDGEVVVDSEKHNLHVMNYSVPVRARLSLADLQTHLYSLPDQPDLIPYRTSYYQENWGFCLPHRLRENLPEGEYEVLVDSSLEDGSLTYGELLLPGKSDQEVLLSTHICHPSLANDNLSGLAVMSRLAAALASVEERRFTYRFLFIPGTIGSMTWLAQNEDAAARVVHGLVASNLGDSGDFYYKKSRQGDAEIDRVAALVLRESGEEFTVEDFVPFGYDERQYCSPGFDMPVGALSRTPYGRYPEYHTSADNLSFIKPENLVGSLRRYLEVLAVLEDNRRTLNLNPKGEPQLGRRGLYRAVGGEGSRERELALLWVLNLSDGKHSLLDIAERSGIAFATVRASANALLEASLLLELGDRELGDQSPYGIEETT